MNKLCKKISVPLLAIMVFSFNSCIGISMNIEMNRNGSGKLIMEYRMSNMLNNIGRLDGNESMPVIPAGRVDWERTALRFPGMSIVSHSMKETAQETIINVTLDFSDTAAMAAFLTSSGSKTSIVHNGQTGSFDIIIFNKSETRYDENLTDLMRTIFNDYNFSITFSAPRNSTMTITNGEGRAAATPSSAVSSLQGRNVSLSMGIMDLIEMSDGLGVVVNW